MLVLSARSSLGKRSTNFCELQRNKLRVSDQHHNFMPEIELAEMRDIVNGNNIFIKKLADDALQKKSINNKLTMESPEQKKTISKLKVKLRSLRAVKARTENVLEGCKEHRYVKAESGRRIYVATVDTKYSGVVYEMGKRLAFYGTFEVMGLKVYQDADRSYNAERSLERNW